MTKCVLLSAVLASMLVAGTAVAQSTSQATSPPTSPVAPPSGPAGPVPAPTTTTTSNSAKAQIEASGYTGVKDLRRQTDGSWLARATKNSTEVSVSVDTKGNVTQMAQ